MGRSTSRSAMMGAAFLALAGCQLITGTFNVDTNAVGSSCAMVGACCLSLTGSQATLCDSYLELQDQQVCAAFLATFPDGDCKSTAQADGGHIIFPDSGMAKHDGGSTSQPDGNISGHDASQGKDVFVGSDSSFPVDAGQDTSTPDPLDGTTWSLSDVQCAGTSVGVDGSAMLTFEGSSVQQTDNLSDGCVITSTLSQATVSGTDITTNDASTSCGTECTSNDNCEAGEIGAVDEPYTLSGSTLTITLPDDTDSCFTGNLQYIWTQI